MDSAQHASLQPDREQNIISLSGTALPPSWQERMKERWHMGLWPLRAYFIVMEVCEPISIATY